MAIPPSPRGSAKPKLLIRPKWVLAFYIVSIVLYAILYWLTGGINKPSAGWDDYLYFSVTTITTLGFGDIIPSGDWGRFLAASEALSGVIVIGVFLSSLWQNYASMLQDANERHAADLLAERDRQRLKAFHGYIAAVISDYTIAEWDLATPLAKRKGEKKLTAMFLFSDLQDMFKSVLSLRRGIHKSAAAVYYDEYSNLVSELKYLLANFDISRHPALTDAIFAFLENSRKMDTWDAILAMETMQMGKETLSAFASRLIAENDICPDIKDHQSSVLTPIIFLYHGMLVQVPLIKKIMSELDEAVKG